MAPSLQTQIEELRRSMEGLESQRSILGEAIVNPAVAALRQQLSTLEQQVAAQPAPSEERRLVSILFVDVVGSTTMAEKVDPEEWHQVLKKLHATLGEKVAVHHGEVGKFLGDGMLAYFGMHKASEEDPENAIRAALDAQAAVSELLSSEKVQIRAGIHTGLVVMGELGETTHMEFTASGDAMNLAARLQSAAPPGGVLISHDTYRYVRGVFDFTARPPLAVKGKSEALQTYLVRRVKPRPFRTASRGVAGVETPTVGRAAEIQALHEAYLRAHEGHGLVWAQLVSAPGLGKSRLVVELADWMDLRPETYRLLRARAFPDDANLPFALVRRMWFDRFQIADDTPLEQAEDKWVEHFRELSGQADCEEAAHALGLLVGLPFENSPHIKAMRNDPAQVKGRAFMVSRELMQAVRAQTPAVVLLEDLQWADAASWEYLMEVLVGPDDGAQPNGLFILGTARPEWHPPQALVELFNSSRTAGDDCRKWGMQSTLAPLSDTALRELGVELFQRAEVVPDQILELLVERSEGVPYYAEELVNWFMDHGILDTSSEPWRFFPERLQEHPLPATLQHLLLTRLSGLSQAERSALQRGAIFGRRFWSGGLDALGVSGGEETLAHLQPRGFIEAQPESAFEGDTEWSFHQTLLQEVTYESVLKRERASLHKVAAAWLERQARQAGRLDEFAGLLGDHCERAGELSAAADWYLRAGKRAITQGAPREARSFFTQALELLPPVDRDRRWQVLLQRETVLSLLAEPEEWKADLAALLELSLLLNDDNCLAEAYLRQAIYGWQAGDVALVEQAARQSLAAAQRCANEGIEARALSALAAAELNTDREAEAVTHTEQALRLARQHGDDSVLAYVLDRAAFCYSELRDFVKADALQSEQIALDHRLGNRAQEMQGRGNQCAAYAAMGLFKQAVALLDQSYALSSSLGARRAMAYDLLNLGGAWRSLHDLRKARQFGEQGVEEMSRTPDKRGRAGALLELGTTLLAMQDAAGAARRFEEAYAVVDLLGLDGPKAECASGLATCAVLQGQLEEASRRTTEAWAYLKEHGWTGSPNPGAAYLRCAETFDALGDTQNTQAVLDTAHEQLLKAVGSITRPEWRQSYLEGVPEHRILLEMWERRPKG